MKNEKENTKGLVAIFFSTKFIVIYAVTIYLCFAIPSGKFIPFDWEPQAISLFVLFELYGLLIFTAVTEYFGVLNIESKIRRIIDINAFRRMRCLDVILAHYTNVATIGLFIGVLIYSIKRYGDLSSGLIASILTLLLMLIFLIYGILFAKLATYFSKRKGVNIAGYFTVTLLVFLVDAFALEMFIDAVPDNLANSMLLDPECMSRIQENLCPDM